MSEIPHLVGMIHLLPLPGSPGFGGSFEHVLEVAVEDASVLADAGFPALMVENFGDAPFYGSSVPRETVAAMSVAVSTVKRQSGLAVGVNVLRNDAVAALAVAAAVGAGSVRVNVLSGMMYTDQGPIVGKAAEVQRLKMRLCPDVEIWADVMVKHATAPPGTDPVRMALDTLERGGANALIVSGSGTGSEPDLGLTRSIRTAIGTNARLVIGSGATPENLGPLCEVADTVIVGSALKHGGVASNRVDPDRAEGFVAAAGAVGLL